LNLTLESRRATEHFVSQENKKGGTSPRAIMYALTEGRGNGATQREGLSTGMGRENIRGIE